MVFKEITGDNGMPKKCFASNNCATYILTSAIAKDKYSDYVQKYEKPPSSRWYNKHFKFTKI